jgi:hypothetical protein
MSSLPIEEYYVRFEVFTAVTLKYGVFWNVTPKVVPSSSTLVTLMMEALRSSETSVLTRATRCNIPEDAILHVSLLSSREVQTT